VGLHSLVVVDLSGRSVGLVHCILDRIADRFVDHFASRIVDHFGGRIVDRFSGRIVGRFSGRIVGPDRVALGRTADLAVARMGLAAPMGRRSWGLDCPTCVRRSRFRKSGSASQDRPCSRGTFP